MNKLFEEIFQEADIEENKTREQNKEFPFNSLEEAFYNEDTSASEHQDVYYENFVWDITKSNDNLKDTGDGKGFSFYYAAQVFKDKYHLTVKNENNPDHPDYDVTTGIVATENAVVVVNTKLDDGKIRIVSSWESKPTSHWNTDYWKRRERKEKNGLEQENEAKEKITYVLLRKPGKLHFDSNSYAKIVKLTDLDFPPYGDYGSFMGRKVFIQKIGNLDDCEDLQKTITAYLNHKKTGFDW